MSTKPNSTVQRNTILNYFQSPGSKQSNSTPKKPKLDTVVKNKSLDENSDEDGDIVRPQKRKKLLLSDSDSDTENISSNTSKKIQVKSQYNESIQTRNLDRFKLDSSVANSSFQSEDDTAELNKSDFDLSALDKHCEINKAFECNTNWYHSRLEFLQPNKILDANRNRPDQPDYDVRTLFVPNKFLDQQTPAQRQWWLMKSQNMNAVLFFKVGKFYELYHMDAIIGVNHLGFSYMKGEIAHSGFPEGAYYKMANALIAKGFKVARCEQTETPEMMTERCKQKSSRVTKFDKVVTREICQISSKATCVYNAQLPDATSNLPCYLFAISEKDIGPTSSNRLGVCFVDTSIGTFHMAEFTDDKHFSILLSIFSEHVIGLILTERRLISNNLKQVLNTYCMDIKREELKSGTEFYTGNSTIEKLLNNNYFQNETEKLCVPEFIEQIRDGFSVKPEYQLMTKCLGACLWYLQHSKLDIQVVSMGKFQLYSPLNVLSNDNNYEMKKFMVLDAVTIKNLDLLGNRGTLQSTLDYCQTAFGKRLLYQWICRPLCDLAQITERQLAIEELKNDCKLLKECQEVLSKLPDLERQVAKIHHYGNRTLAKNHPDSRAIFYESARYSKRRIRDLLKTLKAFEKTLEIPFIFKDCESDLLKSITQYAPVGNYINLDKTLTYFKQAFDQNKAQESGQIIPKNGIDEAYDDAQLIIKEIEDNSQQYLHEQEKFFGCALTYFGNDKKRFQLDIPESYASKVTNAYQLEGTKKGSKPTKRYSTNETRQFLADIIRAELQRDKVIQDLNRRIFEKFSKRYKKWDEVIKCLSILDVLCSLAEYARLFQLDICLPKINNFSKHNNSVVIKNGRHPYISNLCTFIENDIEMGTEDHPKLMIITGPNMGGKSTLMRQTALITIMAHMGSFVPASFCELNLIDRIFIRLGAKDDIVHGHSTFLVELAEASSILLHSTSHSLVLIDELGRGTSTHDGNAIATAYVHKLIERNCRTLFSTHYHNLVDQFVGRNDVQLGHMACLVEKPDGTENAEDEFNEEVTFLYKITDGHCPKSYGFNVARLAGLKTSIISKGLRFAKELEHEAKCRSVFHDIFTDSITNITNALNTLPLSLKN